MKLNKIQISFNYTSFALAKERFKHFNVAARYIEKASKCEILRALLLYGAEHIVKFSNLY